MQTVLYHNNVRYTENIFNKESEFEQLLINNSQNILLVIDGEKKELPEIINTYTDTWGKIVKVTIVKEYTSEGGSILSISPDFENIEIVDITSDDDKPDVQGRYTEEFHLERVNPDIKEIYSLIKTGLSEAIPGLIFNPQRYYISLKKKKNFAYIMLRKKKIRIVVTLNIEKVKERIKYNYVNTLSESVQSFYNSPSCEIVIENKEHLTEVIELLKDIKKIKTGNKKEAVQDGPKKDIPPREMKKPRGLDNLKKIIDGFDS